MVAVVIAVVLNTTRIRRSACCCCCCSFALAACLIQSQKCLWHSNESSMFSCYVNSDSQTKWNEVDKIYFSSCIWNNLLFLLCVFFWCCCFSCSCPTGQETSFANENNKSTSTNSRRRRRKNPLKLSKFSPLSFVLLSYLKIKLES